MPSPTTYAITNPIPMSILTCVVCAISFGLSEGFYDLRREDGESFSCPAGHKQSYVTEEEKEKRSFSTKDYADNAILKSQVQFLSRKLKTAESLAKSAKRTKGAA